MTIATHNEMFDTTEPDDDSYLDAIMAAFVLQERGLDPDDYTQGHSDLDILRQNEGGNDE